MLSIIFGSSFKFSFLNQCFLWGSLYFYLQLSCDKGLNLKIRKQFIESNVDNRNSILFQSHILIGSPIPLFHPFPTLFSQFFQLPYFIELQQGEHPKRSNFPIWLILVLKPNSPDISTALLFIRVSFYCSFLPFLLFYSTI